jgi:hypothetical protein
MKRQHCPVKASTEMYQVRVNFQRQHLIPPARHSLVTRAAYYYSESLGSTIFGVKVLMRFQRWGALCQGNVFGLASQLHFAWNIDRNVPQITIQCD